MVLWYTDANNCLRHDAFEFLSKPVLNWQYYIYSTFIRFSNIVMQMHESLPKARFINLEYKELICINGSKSSTVKSFWKQMVSLHL